MVFCAAQDERAQAQGARAAYQACSYFWEIFLPASVQIFGSKICIRKLAVLQEVAVGGEGVGFGGGVHQREGAEDVGEFFFGEVVETGDDGIHLGSQLEPGLGVVGCDQPSSSMKRVAKSRAWRRSRVRGRFMGREKLERQNFGGNGSGSTGHFAICISHLALLFAVLIEVTMMAVNSQVSW